MPDAVTMPRYFSDNGYWSAGAGKIFHNDQPDPGSWDAYFPSLDRHMPRHHRPRRGTVNMPLFQNMYTAFDWSPIDIPDEETGDYSSVSWVIDRLGEEREDPFFLACGIYRPHLPWYVPQKYFDMFPIDEVQLPPTIPDDLDDVSDRAREIAARAGNYHEHVLAADQWQNAVQGYLASIAYADAMLGRLLDALEESPHGDNTILVVWSDHGWQLGEKEHWRKFALWENLAHSVLFMKVPEGVPGLRAGSVAGARTDRTVSLVDLFPTLLDLSGIPTKEGLDGHSLVPLLKDAEAPWPHPAITTYDFAEFSIRTEDWRYIHYIDGSEELYDHRTDPNEWKNLADDPEHADILAEMKQHIPTDPAPMPRTSYRLAPHHTEPYWSLEDFRRRRRE